MEITLRQLREALELNKRTIAVNIGIDEGLYNKLESGKLTLTKTYIDKIKARYPQYSNYDITNLIQTSGKYVTIQYYEHADAICGIS